MTHPACVNFEIEVYLATRAARLGPLPLGARLRLAQAALALPAEFGNARAAVLRFLDGIEADRPGATAALEEFTTAWVAAVIPPESARPAYDWQARRDCGHD